MKITMSLRALSLTSFLICLVNSQVDFQLGKKNDQGSSVNKNQLNCAPSEKNCKNSVDLIGQNQNIPNTLFKFKKCPGCIAEQSRNLREISITPQEIKSLPKSTPIPTQLPATLANLISNRTTMMGFAIKPPPPSRRQDQETLWLDGRRRRRYKRQSDQSSLSSLRGRNGGSKSSKKERIVKKVKSLVDKILNPIKRFKAWILEIKGNVFSAVGKFYLDLSRRISNSIG